MRIMNTKTHMQPERAEMDGSEFDIEQHIQTQIASFDEIMTNNIPCFFDPTELAGIKGALSQWKRDGYQVTPRCAAWLAVRATKQEIEEFFTQSLLAGWFPFLAADPEGEVFECRLVKVEAGRTFFGRTKYAFRLYLCQPSGRFVFHSEHRSTIQAMWALNKMMGQH